MTPEAFEATFHRIRTQMAKVVVGQEDLVFGLLVAALSGGHVLIEGAPGLGKTLVARSFARVSGASFKRLQFTPDLMPSDVTGSSVLDREKGSFTFIPGPIFCQLLLADEINRAPAKTQSALLEAMQDHQVTVDGVSRPLPQPFMVVATQNPFEFEGTYYLPENQLDRFILRVNVGYPSREAEAKILTTQPGRGALDSLRPVLTGREVVALQDAVPGTRLDANVVNYLLDLVQATREHEQLHLGISPRGALGLTGASQASAVMAGRDFVIPDDIKQMFIPCCAHRVISRSYLTNGDNASTKRILQTVLDTIPTPR